MKRGAIELSASFLVTILIAIVMLGLGILFLRQLFSGAEDIRQDIDVQTESQIEALLNQGQQVAVPFNSQTVLRGKDHLFGVGIVNILDKGTFYMRVRTATAVDKEGKLLTRSDQESWVRYDVGIVTLEKNERHATQVRVNVPSDTVIGTYVFNVEICKGSPSATCNRYDSVKKIYIIVP